jgi:hypothetical protein
MSDSNRSGAARPSARAELPRPTNRPCGLYRTTVPIGAAVAAGVLVYYHNHGDPGPGVYLPRDWRNNRAIFHERGTPVPDGRYSETLQPLPAEGFYRVVEPFFCCDKRCAAFEPDQLVQLGYNGQARPILFLPTLVDALLTIPSTGTFIDDERLAKLQLLKLRVGEAAAPHDARALN